MRHVTILLLCVLLGGCAFPRRDALVVRAWQSEPMACGCPVVCSNATSLPEVGGTAVLYADPQSPAHFAERIASLLADDELRHEMAGKGRLRASTFSHKRYMAELLQIYGELVA